MTEETISDPNTGLMWQRTADYVRIDHLERHCDSLELAGFRDWVLPSIPELMTTMPHTTAYDETLWRSLGGRHKYTSTRRPAYFYHRWVIISSGKFQASAIVYNGPQVFAPRQARCVRRTALYPTPTLPPARYAVTTDTVTVWA